MSGKQKILSDLLQGHTDRVWCCCVAGDPEGPQVFTGGEDGSIRVWSLATRECLAVFEGHKGSITSLCPTDDGVFSTATDKTVILWSFAGEIIRKFTGYQDSLRCCAVSGDQLATGGRDGLVKLRLVGGGDDDQLINIKAHADLVSCVAFYTGEDGSTQVYSGSYDKTIKSWDAADGRHVQVYRGHDHHVKGIAFSPTHPLMFSGSRDGTVRGWNVTEGRALVVLHVDHFINCMGVAGSHVYCGGSDGKVRVVMVKEVMQQVSKFASMNSRDWEAKKVELEQKLEKKVRKLRRELERSIREKIQQDTGGGGGGDGEDGEERDEEDAEAEEAAEDGEDGTNEYSEQMTQEHEAQVGVLQRQLGVKLERLGEVRDRALVIGAPQIEQCGSRLVHQMTYQGPAVLCLAVWDKHLLLGKDNDVALTTSRPNLINL